MSEIAKRIGERIAALRKQAGVTQEELAAWIGSSGQVISKLERGGMSPSVERIAEIAAALRVEPRDLFDFGDEGAPARRPPNERDRLIARMAVILRTRTVTQVRALVQVAEAMEAEAPATKAGRPGKRG